MQRLWNYVNNMLILLHWLSLKELWCVLIGLWPKKRPLHRAEPLPWWSSIGQVRIGAAAQTPKSLPGFQYCKCKAFTMICRNLRPKLIRTWWVASSWECFAPLNLWKWQIEDSQETIWEQLKNTRAKKKKPSYFPQYWFFNKDPYNGLL